MPKPTTFYFYDLETSGVNPRDARVMQFAGQRTDMDLTPVGEPHNLLIKLSEDVVPEPDAILIHGFTPQKSIAEGMTEVEFLRIFHAEIATPGTIFVGFNTIRFDDEFLRFMHYRNFYDAYEWQWQDGRSRWDMLDVVRMTRALRPEGIKWPVDSQGKPTNRLELLTAVNGLDHEHAHDALNDVLATIALARLIKTKQPKLFDYLLSIRGSSDGKKKIEVLASGTEPFVYTSGKYSATYEKTTVVATIAGHPKRAGAALVYDLRHDPEPFLGLSPDQLAECWRWKKDRTELQLPVKTLQFNRCPAIAPLSVLDAASQQRLNLDSKKLQANLEKLRGAKNFVTNLFDALELMDERQQARFLEDEAEVDAQLYEGFFGDQDRTKMSVVRAADPADLKHIDIVFKDQRLQTMLPLYKARNFPNSLSESDKEIWQQFKERKLYGGKDNSRLARYFKRLSELGERTDLSGQQKYLLTEMELYGQSLMPEY